MLPAGSSSPTTSVGIGEPLLFIHGWPHDRSLWAAQLGGLATQARCIAPDLRGFGESTVDRPVLDRPVRRRPRGAARPRWACERAVVCGLSMGGYVALSMLRRHRAARARARARQHARHRGHAEAREKRDAAHRVRARSTAWRRWRRGSSRRWWAPPPSTSRPDAAGGAARDDGRARRCEGVIGALRGDGGPRRCHRPAAGASTSRRSW